MPPEGAEAVAQPLPGEPRIHPSAIIHPTAEISPTAAIGPYCIVGEHSRIGPYSVLHPHVTIVGYTLIGAYCNIYPGAMLGGPPQDRKFSGEGTYLIIGDRTEVRECVTIHRATGEGATTTIGEECMIMAYSHIGHNCQIGKQVILANNAGISGHVVIEDFVNIGGYVGVHQYTRCGTLAFVGGMSKVVRDVPPYALVDGHPAEVKGLNSVGLRRAGVPLETREKLKRAFHLLYRSQLNLTQAIRRIREEIEPAPEVQRLLLFLEEIHKGYGGRARDPRGRRE